MNARQRIIAAGERLDGHTLVVHLNSLVIEQDLGALALLRRGLGRQPGDVPEIYVHVLPYLNLGESASSAWRECVEDAALLMASLYALWHQGKPKPNVAKDVSLGAAFAQVKTNSGSIEHRFVALLKASRDRLPDHLRQAIALLKTNDIALDWDLLFQAIARWGNSKREPWHPMRTWARDFWGRQTAPESTLDIGGEDAPAGKEGEAEEDDEDDE